jgi:hypothetical protein
VNISALSNVKNLTVTAPWARGFWIGRYTSRPIGFEASAALS